MPENHDFEKAMQQQLDGFQVTPQPSDWQAVYEQLHPHKKRRPIWWWIPAMLMMLALGWYISKEPNGTAQNAKTFPAPQPTLSKPVPDQTNAISPQVSTTTDAEETGEMKNKREQTSNEKTQSPTGSTVEHKQASRKMPIATDAVAKTEKANTSIPKSEKNSNRTATISKTSSSNKNVALIESQNGEQAIYNNTTVASYSNDVDSDRTYHLGLVQQAFIHKTIVEAATLKGPIPLKRSEGNDQQKTAASQTKQPAKWHWGLYAGIGANRLTEPISMLKSQADNMSNNPGSSRLVSTSNEQNGWHYNAGFFVNRKWNRNWQFTTGGGVNASTWKTNVTTYVDSILPAGTLYSRGLVSSVQKTNTLWMVELPLQISNRIAGKGVGTFWWTAGINNQFLLSLKEQTTTSSVLNNFATTSDEKSLTSGVNKYQPQLRAGFIYDYAGKKSHWQLVPLINIGLVKPLQSGDFNLMNMQLQGRWFFGRQ